MLCKIVTFCVIWVFFLCWIEGWDHGQSNPFLEHFFEKNERLLFLFVATVLCSVGVWKLFCQIDKLSKKQLWICAGGLFAISVCIYAVLIGNLHVIPRNDCHSMLDQALYFAESGEKPISKDSIYINYFTKYGNNYLLTVMFSWYYKIVSRLNIGHYYTMAYFVNALCLVIGTVFTFLIAKKIRGLSCAVKTLVFCVANPVYYLMVFWVYSNTISVPFMMGILYFGICLYETKSYPLRVLLTGVCCFLAVVSYFIRPTAIFPFIALFIGMLFFAIKKFRHSKFGTYRYTKCILLLVLAMVVSVGTYMGIKHISDCYFGKAEKGNYPVTHWLMMGSHDNGQYNVQDDLYTRGLDNKEKMPKTLKKTWENYKSLGVRKIFPFWMNKMKILWSDGSFSVNCRLTQTVGYTKMDKYITGRYNQIVLLYCQVFWLMTFFFLLTNLVRQLMRKQILTYDFIFTMVLFGAILLYFVWEVKAEYALPFLPIFFLIAGNLSIPSLSELFNLKLPSRKVLMSITGIGFVVYVGVLQFIYEGEVGECVYSIKSYGYTWLYDMDLESGDQVVQTFYPEKQFDTLEFCVRLSDGTNASGNDGVIHVDLYDGKGKFLYGRDISSQIIQGIQKVTVDVGDLPASTTEGYRLEFTVKDGDNGRLVLRTTKGMCLDMYPGAMQINGKDQPLDLYMSVYKKYEP